MDKKTAIKELTLHVQSLGGRFIRDEEFWKDICETFPQFVYHGLAYKAVLCDRNELDLNFINRVGKSWSLSKQGVLQFLENGSWYDVAENKDFFLVESNIVGFGIIHLAAFLKNEENDLILELPPMVLREEEVVLIEHVSIFSKRWTNLKKFKKSL